MHTIRATSRKESLASLRRKALPLSLSLLLCGALASTPAQAGSVARTTTPTGGSVVGGEGSIVQSGASVVVNQVSQKLALDWQSFNLGEDALVRFNQPGTSAVALNRILDQNPSQIFGQISSNGQVFLINTHGIIFGTTAQVNVGGLVASTLDLTPTDFLSNHFNLDKVGGGAGIVNHGTIAAASGGSVSLIGGSVQNDGVILANYGRINLDGAEHAVLDFDGNGLINVQITGELKQRLDAKAAVNNAGTLQADGGTVVLEASAARDLFTHLVNNSGVIDAGAISHDGGVVRLVARGGDTASGGSIDVSGNHGGSAQLLSDRNVAVSGDIDASGAQGGGSIRIGGGAQGGEGLLHASTSTVGADASLSADATQSGKGGSIVVWSDRDTQVAGRFSARGGAQGGDGGLVETSADHVHIADTTRVDTRAAAGRSGTWLIDPVDFTIKSSGGDMDADTLEDNLSSSDVVISSSMGSSGTEGNINVEQELDWTAHTLTLSAVNDINIDAPVTTSGTAGLVLDPGTGGVVNLTDTLMLGGSGGLTLTGTLRSTSSGVFDIAGLDSGVSIGGLDGDGLVNLGANALTLSNADDGVFNGSIEGAGGSLVLAGGMQTLGGTNTYTGATDIIAGTLALTSAGSVTASSGVIADGTFDISGTSGASITSLGGSGTVMLGSQTLTLSNASGNFGGVINGSGGLTLAGGTEMLTGSNTYTGATHIDAGTLKLSGAGSVATSSGVTADGTLDISGTDAGASVTSLDGSGTVTLGSQTLTLSNASGSFAGAIDGSGGLTLAGGSETLTGSNTYTGATAIATGATLKLSGAGSVATSSGVTADGTLDISGTDAGASVTSLDGSGTVTLGSQTLTLSNASGSFAGTIGGSGGLTLAGGSETLTGSNTYTGATHIDAGTLKLSGAGSVAASSGVTAEGTLDISGTTSGASIVSLDGGGTVTLGGQTLTLSNASGSFGGGIAGSGGLTLAGGNETLSGNNTYSGDTTLSGGVLTVSSDANLGDAAGDLVFDGGTLATTGIFSSARDVNLQGDGTLQTGANLDLSGVISGSGKLTKSGGGTLTLSAANTYTGATDIAAGTLALTGAGSLADSSGVTADGTFDISGTSGASIASLDGSGTVTLGSQTLTLSDASGSFGGAIDGSGGLTLAGGSETLTGSNTYSGATDIISGATLKLTGAGSVADSSGVTVDGVLDISGTTSGASITSLDGSGLVALGNQTLTLSNASGDFGGTIGGAGGLTIAGGTQTLSGMNIYSGATRIDAGTLKLSYFESVAASGDVIVDGTLDISAQGATIISLDGSGAVVLGNQTLTLSNASGDFGGTISGFGGLTLAGGSQTLSGNNSYSGGTTVSGGTLSISSNGNLGAISGALTLDGGTLKNTASLELARTLTLGTNGGTLQTGAGTNLELHAVSGTGGLTQTGTGSLTLSGDVNTGGSQSYGSDVFLGSDVKLTSTAGSIGFAGAVDNADATAHTLSVNAGNGSVSFDDDVGFGANGRLAGLTTDSQSLSAQRLAVSGDLSVTTTGGDIVQNGAFLVGGHADFDAGSHAISLADSGNDFTGTVDLAGGTTAITDSSGLALGTLATGDLSVASHGPLDLGSGSVDGHFQANSNGGAITQTAALVVTGTSTIDAGAAAIDLGAANDFQGAVSLLNSGANDVTLDNGSNALLMGASTLGSGALSLAGNGITQSGSITQVAGAGTVNLQARGGALALEDAGNAFTGLVSAQGTGVSLQTTGDLHMLSLDAGTNGSVSLAADGTLDLAAVGAIDTGLGDLNLHAGDSFASGANLSGNNVSLRGDGGLTLNSNVTANGSLELISSNAPITQTTGTLQASGTTTVDAGTGDISLTEATNDFIGDVTLTGRDTAITDANQLHLAGLDTRNLTAESTGSLTLGSGTVDGVLTAHSNGGNIGQASGGLTVTGTSSIDAGGGTIALTEAGNDFQDVVDLTGATVAIVDTNALTLGALTTGDLSATSHGDLTLGASTVTGTLDLASNGGDILSPSVITAAGIATIDAGGGQIQLDGLNDFQSTVNLAGGDTVVTDANALTLGTLDTGALTVTSTGNLDLGSGSIGGDLSATSHGGAVSQTDALDVQGAGILDAGTGTITLTNAGNHFADAVSLTGAGIAVRDVGDLTVAALANQSDTDVSLIAGGALTLPAGAIDTGTADLTLAANGATLDTTDALSGANVSLSGRDGVSLGDAVSATNTLTLSSATGDITQQAAGTLTAAHLTGSAGGSVLLDQANAIGQLDGFSADGFTLNNAGNLTVAGPVDGGSTGVDITSNSGLLTIAGDIDGGSIALQGVGISQSGGVIDAGSGQVSLQSGAGIAQTGGSIAAGTLTGSAVGDVGLNGANQVNNLGSFSAAKLSLNDAVGLTLAGPVTVTGSAALTVGGTLAINQAFNASTTTLDVDGAITEGSSGSLTTGTLSGQAGGNVALTRSNHVGTLGSFSATGFALTNGQALTATGSLAVGSGNLTLTTTSGALTMNSALSGGTITLDSAAGLALGNTIHGSTVNLESGGSISQTAGGLITASTLNGQSAGSTVLNRNNAISVLGNFTASGFSLTSNRALTISGTVDGGASTVISAGGKLSINGTVQGDATSLAASGTMSEGAHGKIVATTLTGHATGAATLDGANLIGTLGNFQAAGLSLRNAQNLLVAGTVDGGSSTTLDVTGNLGVTGTIEGSSSRLDATGSLSETGAGRIVADTFSGHAGGSASLTGNNAITTLGDLDATGLSFTNGNALTISGTVDGGATTTLTTTSGGLTVNGSIAGTSTKLAIAGAIDQSSHGRVTASTLTGQAGGDVALDGDNRIDVLGAFSAHDFALRNGKALVVNGPLTASSGYIALTTTAGTLSVDTALSGDTIALDSAGDLALGRALHGGAVTLQSGGRISQTAGGLITADSLSGHSAGSTTLDQANAIAALGNFSANGLALTSKGALTVNGPVDGGGSTTLTTGGNLTLAGSLSGDTTTLAVNGAISEGSAGSLTAHVLSGHATGSASLTGANRIDTLGAFTASGFALSNGPSLTVTGPLDGGSGVALTTTRGDLLIDGKVSGKTTTLTASGAITEGQGGSIVADTLSGQAGGVTSLGTASSPLANYIGTLGGFSSRAGFSLTNAQTLTLASVGGSAYTVDAGTSPLYLAVSGGDLLQIGKTWLYDGAGTFSSTGRIGTSDAPIYVTGTSAQAVAVVGVPPAYFYAVNGRGGVLPLTGGSSVNVPTSLFTSRAQNANNHSDVYIDPSVISANYRSFGIVPSGILLPPDQQACDPELEECDE